MNRRGFLQGLAALPAVGTIIGCELAVRRQDRNDYACTTGGVTDREVMTATEVKRRQDEYWRRAADMAANPPIMVPPAFYDQLIELGWDVRGIHPVRLLKV